MPQRLIPVSSEESADLLADPPRLYARWRALLAEHPHLHGPEAAALLGVPEAALLASATGRGNIPLAGSLADILAPVASWGRVLLAARNALGVHLDVMGPVHLELTADELVLRDEQHEVRFATRGIARIDLFEESNAHGRTLSLNWFDPTGHAIGRLFLLSKDGRERAMPHLLHFRRLHATDRWTSGAAEMPLLLQLLPMQLGGDITQLNRGRISEWAAAAILCCDHAGGMEVGLAGAGVAAVYRGRLAKVFYTPPTVHATDLLCKLHVRPGAATAVYTFGEFGLSVRSADGGELRLKPLGDDSGAWRERVRERALVMQSPSLAVTSEGADQ